MMNYEIFKVVVAEKIKGYMPEEFSDYNVSIRSVSKVNCTLDSLCLEPTDGTKLSVVPTLYINNLYQDYENCDDLQKVLCEGAEVLINAFHNSPRVSKEICFETASDNIIMVLVNTEQNKELLKTVPNRQFNDLSIMYRWLVKEDEDAIGSTIIRYELAEKLGMSEEELYNAAFKNTARLLPVTVKSIYEIMHDMFIAEGMPEELAKGMTKNMTINPMYVISNQKGINGAASILYEENLFQLAQKLDSDLFLLPSSVHEAIAIPANTGTPDELSSMVEEINFSQVDLSERLSNQVYRYDRNTREITLASNNPNMSIIKSARA